MDENLKAGLIRAGRVILSGAITGIVAKVSTEYGAQLDAIKIMGFISLGGVISGLARWARGKYPKLFTWLPI